MIVVRTNSIFGSGEVRFPDTEEGRTEALAEAERINAGPDAALIAFDDCPSCLGYGHDAGRVCRECAARVEPVFA